MTGKELYPLVHRIVRRAQNEDHDLQRFPNYFEWSKHIPKPNKVSKELASALCTSVSCSQGVGLEIFYQQKVYLTDLEATGLTDPCVSLLGRKDPEGTDYRLLGEIIRTAFTGRMVPNEDDNALLRSIQTP